MSDTRDIYDVLTATEEKVNQRKEEANAKRAKKLDKIVKKQKAKNKENISNPLEMLSIIKDFKTEDVVNADTEETADSTDSNTLVPEREQTSKTVSLLKEDIDRYMSGDTIEIVSETTEDILLKTKRSIQAVHIINKTTNDKESSSMVLKALDGHIKESINSVADSFVSKIMAKENDTQKEIRYLFSDIFKDYIKYTYISTKIKAEKDILSENETLVDIDDEYGNFRMYDGLLQAPILYQLKALKSIQSDERVEGKVQRGAGIYSEQIENIAVINIFPEDIFDVF